MASGYPDEALYDFDHAIQLQPSFPQAHTNRANALYRQGHIGRALTDFVQAVAITQGPIALVLAIVLLGTGLAFRAVRRKRPQ